MREKPKPKVPGKDAVLPDDKQAFSFGRDLPESGTPDKPGARPAVPPDKKADKAG